MEIIVFLSIVIAVLAILTSIVLIRRVKKQIAEITDALVDVKNGNGNRRILSATNELVAPLAYEINEIVVAYESRLSTVRQTEETNRQLMTSLSHDVRTPLTTLIGYLDAAHKGIVTGKDRDDYIETARRKAHDLKEYIDVLFDWFKLNSNEVLDLVLGVAAGQPVCCFQQQYIRLTVVGISITLDPISIERMLQRGRTVLYDFFGDYLIAVGTRQDSGQNFGLSLFICHPEHLGGIGEIIQRPGCDLKFLPGNRESAHIATVNVHLPFCQ